MVIITSSRENKGDLIMSLKQLTIFVENKQGTLVDITDILAKNNVNMRALSIADTQDFGILRLIVNDVEKASDVLKNEGFLVTVTNVLALKISDKPGGLADAMEAFGEDSISVEYLYAAFVNEKDDTASLILRVNDNDVATKALEKKGFNLLSEDELV